VVVEDEPKLVRFHFGQLRRKLESDPRHLITESGIGLSVPQ
jgi:DNA-binding response OmpR family regulator